jgi:hypothetical protein
MPSDLVIDDKATQVQKDNNPSHISNIIEEEDQVNDEEMMMIDVDGLISAQILEDSRPKEIVNQNGDVLCKSSGREYHQASHNHQLLQTDSTDIQEGHINNISNITRTTGGSEPVTVSDHELLVQDRGTDGSIVTFTQEGHLSDELTSPSTPPTQKSRKRKARPHLWKKTQKKDIESSGKSLCQCKRKGG